MNLKEKLIESISLLKRDIAGFDNTIKATQRYKEMHQESVKAIEKELQQLEDKEKPPKEFWANEYGGTIPAFHTSEESARKNAVRTALRVAVLYREVKE